MQRWPLELEHIRIVTLASVSVARSMPAAPDAFLSRAAAAFYDARRLCQVAAAHKQPDGGRWSRRLVALRDQIDQAGEAGLSFVETARADPGDRSAAAGVVEMLAALQFLLVSAGQGVGVESF